MSKSNRAEDRRSHSSVESLSFEEGIEDLHSLLALNRWKSLDLAEPLPQL